MCVCVSFATLLARCALFLAAMSWNTCLILLTCSTARSHCLMTMMLLVSKFAMPALYLHDSQNLLGDVCCSLNFTTTILRLTNMEVGNGPLDEDIPFQNRVDSTSMLASRTVVHFKDMRWLKPVRNYHSSLHRKIITENLHIMMLKLQCNIMICTRC